MQVVDLFWQPAVPFLAGRCVADQPAAVPGTGRAVSAQRPGASKAERAFAATREKKPFYVRLVVDTQHVFGTEFWKTTAPGAGD
jgi:hypothetical protein